jgi:L-iditol 2-dehydrogenase
LGSLPKDLPLEMGALVEPLSVAMHAADRAKTLQGTTVLVLGAGAVGLLCAAVSKVRGASTVVIADIQADRTDFAVSNGFADAAILVPPRRPETIEDKLAYAQEVASLVKTATNKAGSDEAAQEVSIAFECTGVESCLQTAIFVRLDP